VAIMLSGPRVGHSKPFGPYQHIITALLNAL
jgi:hypothetical protein